MRNKKPVISGKELMTGIFAVLFCCIAIGAVGIVGIGAAYPLYIRVTKRRRDKLAPEIVRSTDELMK